jgi:parallel beta-helix repeat protein
MGKKPLIVKWLSVGIILLFVGVTIAPATAQNTEKQSVSRGNWLYVGGSGPGNYSRIQDAIDNANDGDTVYVYDDSSPYNEEISIQKQLHLLGENKETTIIDSPNPGVAIDISSTAGVRVEGFTIKSSDLGTIHISFSSFNTINNNYITANSYDGIFLILSSDNSITDNVITAPESGLRLYQSSRTLVSNNTFHKGGLWLQDSWLNNVHDNNTVNGKPLLYLQNAADMILSDPAGQIILIGCENITVTNQNISNVVIGIQLYDSYNCSLLRNVLSSSTFSNSKGIEMIDSHNIRVCNNTITRLHALIAKNCDNIIILQNTIINVTSGIELSYCTNSVISLNTLKRAATLISISLRLCRTCTISFNNFVDTSSFLSVMFEELPGAQNRWWRNYWQRPRILPKPIFGMITDGAYFPTRIYWIHFDFFPAQQPYNITGGMN